MPLLRVNKDVGYPCNISSKDEGCLYCLDNLSKDVECLYCSDNLSKDVGCLYCDY